MPQTHSDLNSSTLSAQEPIRDYLPLDVQPSDKRLPLQASSLVQDLLSIEPRLTIRTIEPSDIERAAQHPSRMLALIAQTHPALLACLLCHANKNGPPTPRGYADTAEEALRILGPELSAAALLDAVEASPSASRIDDECFHALMQRAIGLAFTARRLARHLGFSRNDTTVLYLAALMDGMGLCAVLHAAHAAVPTLAQTLNRSFTLPETPLRRTDALNGYAFLSAKLARRWSAPSGVVQALEHANSDAGLVLEACERLLIAKRVGTSQRQVLLHTLPDALVPGDSAPHADVDIAFVWDH